jgi:hypothetical protein
VWSEYKKQNGPLKHPQLTHSLPFTHTENLPAKPHIFLKEKLDFELNYIQNSNVREKVMIAALDFFNFNQLQAFLHLSDICYLIV